MGARTGRRAPLPARSRSPLEPTRPYSSSATIRLKAAGQQGREWHVAAVDDVCSNVRSWEYTGSVMLTLSFPHVDPIRTSPGYTDPRSHCRGAEGQVFTDLRQQLTRTVRLGDVGVAAGFERLLGIAAERIGRDRDNWDRA